MDLKQLGVDQGHAAFHLRNQVFKYTSVTDVLEKVLTCLQCSQSFSRIPDLLTSYEFHLLSPAVRNLWSCLPTPDSCHRFFLSSSILSPAPEAVVLLPLSLSLTLHHGPFAVYIWANRLTMYRYRRRGHLVIFPAPEVYPPVLVDLEKGGLALAPGWEGIKLSGLVLWVLGSSVLSPDSWDHWENGHSHWTNLQTCHLHYLVHIQRS